MANKKNLVEEALLQMENLQEAISENAKGILASTMKEEISELVKESMSETNEDDEIEVSDTEMSEQEELDLDVEVDDEDVDMEDLGLEDLEDEIETDNDGLDLDNEMGNDEMLSVDLPGDDLEVDDEEEVLLPLDLTSASDDEVLKVFKAMGQEDGIIVKQDGDDIHLADDEADTEYVIQLGESEETDETIGNHLGEEDHMEEGEYTEEDVVYEIEIGEEDSEEEDSEEEDSEEEDSEEEKGETKEGSARSHVNGRATNLKPEGFPETLKRAGVRENKKLKSELTQLREKNEEYRKALNVFKEKLNEVAIFNSNLAYATRLFTEHSTTKKEKINILRRFDGVETLKESKSLYKTIKEDLGGKETTVVTETVQSKVQKTPSNGSANNLIESKTYENPQFLRMRDLMSKIK